MQPAAWRFRLRALGDNGRWRIIDDPGIANEIGNMSDIWELRALYDPEESLPEPEVRESSWGEFEEARG